MTPKKLWAILALLLSLMIAASAEAAVVGRFTAVAGHVDILKQGKVPGTAARVNDGVEPGDVIRTKTASKAQLKFMDDSQVTLAPDSRMAVADFVFDANRGERRAVLRFYKGVIHTVVTRLLHLQEPNFLMHTHTAILGVRGTETYTVLLPNATGAYLIDGLLEATSNNPQIQGGQMLHNLEFSTIPLGQPPTLPRPISLAMLEMLKKLMDTGLQETAFLGVGAAPAGPEVLRIPAVLGFTAQERLNQPIIPPQVVPPVMTTPTPALTPSGGSATGS